MTPNGTYGEHPHHEWFVFGLDRLEIQKPAEKTTYLQNLEFEILDSAQRLASCLRSPFNVRSLRGPPATDPTLPQCWGLRFTSQVS